MSPGMIGLQGGVELGRTTNQGSVSRSRDHPQPIRGQEVREIGEGEQPHRSETNYKISGSRNIKSNFFVRT